MESYKISNKIYSDIRLDSLKFYFIRWNITNGCTEGINPFSTPSVPKRTTQNQFNHITTIDAMSNTTIFVLSESPICLRRSTTEDLRFPRRKRNLFNWLFLISLSIKKKRLCGIYRWETFLFIIPESFTFSSDGLFSKSGGRYKSLISIKEFCPVTKFFRP